MPKVRDMIAEVVADGWVLDRTRGSHRIFKHPTKRGTVVIPGQLNQDLATGTAHNIRKQAGFKEQLP